MTKTFIDAMLSMEDIPYLGEDKHGFKYYMGPDNYVYQIYPDRDFWVCGENRRNQLNGWYCSGPAWERTMKRCIIN